MGGRDAPEDEWVVQITASETSIQCSGTLVAPNLVLTARHCVASFAVGEFACDPRLPPPQVMSPFWPARQLRVFAGPARVEEPRGATPDAVGAQIFAEPKPGFCQGDLALVLLDRPIAGVRRVPLRLTDTTRVGEPVFTSGWGVVDTFARRLPARQRRDDLTVLSVGPLSYEIVEGTPAIFTAPGQLIVGQSSCSGDSGAPLMAAETGAVVAVFSTNVNAYPEKYTDDTLSEPYAYCGLGAAAVFHTLANRPFVLEAFAASGHRPWLEGQPEPAAFGQACAGPDGCDSGLCVSGAGAPFCSAACDEAACPDGFECIRIDGRAVCGRGGAALAGDGGGGCRAAAGGAPAGGLVAALGGLLAAAAGRRAGRRGARAVSDRKAEAGRRS
ncbi:MAG TPA: S1 family peptidase [Polyangiaceae bacterium]|nr:S1 family peptidase [Polyangiaceae bacterium]